MFANVIENRPEKGPCFPYHKKRFQCFIYHLWLTLEILLLFFSSTEPDNRAIFIFLPLLSNLFLLQQLLAKKLSVKETACSVCQKHSKFFADIVSVTVSFFQRPPLKKLKSMYFQYFLKA